jgi:hypothetical protein
MIDHPILAALAALIIGIIIGHNEDAVNKLNEEEQIDDE